MARIAVLGTGVMGAQISAAFALAGESVILYNRKDPSAVLPRLKQALRLGARRGLAAEGADLEAMLAGVKLTDRLEDVKDADLVLESVVEDLAVKQALFKALAGLCAPSSVLATNTSSLDILEIGRDAGLAERLVGLHFFNPVFDTDLVELVIAPKTRPDVVERAAGFAKAVKKTPLTVPESCVNRILFPMINEACLALDMNVFKAEDIDAAFKLGAKHPIGPLALADLVGLDVVVAILESLRRRLGERYKPAALLTRLVSEGRLGRKSGAGIFTYGKPKGV